MQQLSLINAVNTVVLDPNLTSKQISIVDDLIDTHLSHQFSAAMTNDLMAALIAGDVASPLMQNPAAPYFISGPKLALYVCNPKCAHCGTVCDTWVSYKQTTADPRQGMYAVGMKGNTVVKLTYDHILPRAMGGTDSIDNIQPLCNLCNAKKSNMPTLDDVRQIQQNRTKHAKRWVNDDCLNLALQLIERYHLCTGKKQYELAKHVDVAIKSFKHGQSHTAVDKAIRELTFALDPRGYTIAKQQYEQAMATRKKAKKKLTQEKKRMHEAESHPSGLVGYWTKYWMRRIGHWMIKTGT